MAQLWRPIYIKPIAGMGSDLGNATQCNSGHGGDLVVRRDGLEILGSIPATSNKFVKAKSSILSISQISVHQKNSCGKKRY